MEDYKMKVCWYIDFSKNLDYWDFCKKFKKLPMKVQIRKRKRERIRDLKRWSKENPSPDNVFTSKDRKKTLKELINFKFYND